MLSLILTVIQLLLSTHAHSVEDDTEPCQPITPERYFPPTNPHQYLNTSVLDDYEEIIVIGDVHGCYDEMQLLLDKIRSNNVFKIFAGDLAMKGPKSMQVLEYVKACKTCITVRGNIDEKVLLQYYSHKLDNFTYSEEDKWMENLTYDIITWMQELPYTLSIPSLNSIIVHAGLIPGIPLEKNNPYTMMNVRDLEHQDVCPGGWRVSRYVAGPKGWASQWKGPTHIYFGHDHQRLLQTYPFATGVDTGCVDGYSLTGVFIKGPRKGTFLSQPSFRKYFINKG